MAPKHVPDAELAVLRVLWDRGPSSTRDLADAVYPRGAPAAQSTVQKLLERLEGRSCVERQREGRQNRWKATVERGDLIRDRLRDAVDKLAEGSWTPVLTELVRADGLTRDDIAALRRLVTRHDSGRKGE
jgi:predicted transcriptional regulator